MSDYTITDKLQLAAWYYVDKIKRNLKVTDPKAWSPSLWNLYGMAKTESGVQVDEHSASNLSSVYAAINIISGDISSLPLNLYKKLANGKRKVITDHPSLQVLNYRANPLIPSINFRKTTTAHILSWGNMYAEIARNTIGNVTNLFLITPDRVHPEWKNGTLVYRINMDTEADVYLPREDVLHIAGLGYNGLVGYSVISKAAESIGLSMASEKFGARYFGANTNMGGAIKYPRAMGQDVQKNLKASLADYTGGKHSHRWMILEQGMEIEKLGFSPDDSQFLQTRQFQVSEIARWFNMPPHKLKDLTRSTFSNIEEQETEYVVSCLVPWLTIIEQNYNIQLLTEKEHRLGYYFKHNVKGLLRGSSTARADYYTKRFYLGTITPNEIRAFEDEDPLDTEYADKAYIQMNVMPLDDIDKEPVVQQPQNIPGEQPPEAEEPEPEVKNVTWARDNIKLIEYRNIKGRDRISKRYYPLIEEAASRIVYREAGLVTKHFNGAVGDIERAYDGFKGYIVNKIGPVFRAFSDSVFNQALLEIGESVEQTPDDVILEINRYTDVYSKRHVGSSVGQLTKIVTDNTEGVGELISDRLDQWRDTRSTKIANNETVRLASFAAQAAFFSYGFKSYWRVRGVKTCPYCMELNGKAIKQNQTFFDGGEEHEPKGAKNGPMLIRGIVTHPPLHQGCDCYISVR